MSDSSSSRRFSLKSFWPWPGTVLLVIFAAWLFYMGSVTSDGDVRTALYGLGAASIVLILLALRSANIGAAREPRPERKSPSRRTTPDIEPEVPTYALAEDDSDVPGEPAVGAGSLDNVEPLPQSRTPARHRRDDDDEEEAEYEEEQPARRQPAQVYELDLDEDDIIEALDHLRAMINREKAERGAQIARIDAALANRGDGAVSVVTRESAVGLEERLNQYLTIPAFNNAMHQKVFPRIEQMVESALQEMLTPERLAGLAGAAGGPVARSSDPAERPRTPAGGEDDDAAAAGAAEVHAALQAHIDAATADRDLLREEVRGARQMAERAVRLINRRLGDAAAEGGTGGGSLTGTVEAIAKQQEADRSDIAALRNALNELRLQAATGGSGGDVVGEGKPAAASLMEDIKRDLEAAGRESVQRVEQRMASFEELNNTVSGMVERLNVVDRRQKTMSKRLLVQEQAGGGETGGSQNEVEALRQALAEVMQQTNELRARQDAISAKLGSGPDAA